MQNVTVPCDRKTYAKDNDRFTRTSQVNGVTIGHVKPTDDISQQNETNDQSSSLYPKLKSKTRSRIASLKNFGLFIERISSTYDQEDAKNSGSKSVAKENKTKAAFLSPNSMAIPGLSVKSPRSATTHSLSKVETKLDDFVMLDSQNLCALESQRSKLDSTKTKHLLPPVKAGACKKIRKYRTHSCGSQIISPRTIRRTQRTRDAVRRIDIFMVFAAFLTFVGGGTSIYTGSLRAISGEETYSERLNKQSSMYEAGGELSAWSAVVFCFALQYYIARSV
eukprot:CAMPEP_0114516276 /NCGR_PEP_ID=MMETSP0109-20121206/17240_1 /TAXON_ID=29199 /ORGANISM="Chlorarachnion reptans, Strain CCCM449" /LENGTH=278 /DNA_ID=CAMNT_0001696651 /DNA_START=828 /DNA_END=1664 /DNA_ORIENTATION=+